LDRKEGKRLKSHFVGLRMSEKQKSALSNLQKASGLGKTQLLLKGLEILGEYYSLGFDQPHLSLELKELEVEALRHAEAIKQIRQKGLAIKLIVQELRGIDAIVEKYKGDKSQLVHILLDVQKKYRWLPHLALMWVSEKMEIPLAQVYTITSFYKAFSLAPRGEHLIRLCMGTSCKVRGAPIILDRVQSLLGIKRGETTPDGMFTLESVNCLGCCALGPMMTVDGEYYGDLKLLDVKKILSRYK